MIHKYLSFSVSVAFISWMVGMALNAVVRKTNLFNECLSNLNFVKDSKTNKLIGVGLLKWIVINSFFKYFNQRIKLTRRIEKPDLYNLRHEMTISEIDHLIGFLFVNVFVFVKIYNTEYLFAFAIFIVNLIMNLYPSLLQQENKRRIDMLIKRI